MPALWLLLLPNLLLPLGRAWWATILSLAPAAALLGLGAAAWHRGMVSGVWLAPWEIVVAILALALAFVRSGRIKRKRKKKKGRR